MSDYFCQNCCNKFKPISDQKIYTKYIIKIAEEKILQKETIIKKDKKRIL